MWRRQVQQRWQFVSDGLIYLLAHAGVVDSDPLMCRRKCIKTLVENTTKCSPKIGVQCKTKFLKCWLFDIRFFWFLVCCNSKKFDLQIKKKLLHLQWFEIQNFWNFDFWRPIFFWFLVCCNSKKMIYKFEKSLNNKYIQIHEKLLCGPLKSDQILDTWCINLHWMSYWFTQEFNYL